MVIDTLENCSRYESLHPRFKAAFDFLKRAEAENVPIGRIDLDGNTLYALTQEYDTKPIHDGKLEAHRKYIDIQFILEGEEFIGYAPLKNQKPATAFTPRKTLASTTARLGSPCCARACLRSSFRKTPTCRGAIQKSRRT